MNNNNIEIDDLFLQRYIVDGFVTLQTDHPQSFHDDIWQQIDRIFSTDGNPGNDILPLVPDLYGIVGYPTIDRALTAILGPGYVIHPHRHCHYNPPGSEGQQMHMDSYEADENVRHHRSRWAMAFYYPQDVDETMGPSSILPGSQYYVTSQQAHKQPEIPLCGRTGTVTIVHYDLWHRAMPNLTDKKRYMVKFLFRRTQEPETPSWQHKSDTWQTPTSDLYDSPPDSLTNHIWNWHLGYPSGNGEPIRETGAVLDKLDDGQEADRLDVSYQLSQAGEAVMPALIDRLRKEARWKLEDNLDKSHTNACQFQTAYALNAMGKNALPALMNLLRDGDWSIRGAAVDILGDMGTIARDAVPEILKLVDDESKWVRRNAAEALGNIGLSNRAVRDGFASLLKDDEPYVSLNAVYGLSNLPMDDDIHSLMEEATENNESYVRSYAELILKNTN